MSWRTSWCLLLLATPAISQEKPIPEGWDYSRTLRTIVGVKKTNPGVVLHIGDSITYSNPYGQWARNGEGKTDADKAVLQWMHLNANNDSDGWYLARFDHPEGGRSYTACSGIRIDEMLAGGKRNMPPLEKILDTYRPQLVVFMLGANDASANRKLDAFKADYKKAIDLMIGRSCIPIVSTIPPHHNRGELAKSYNEAIRELAKQNGLPMIDYEKEILTRRPDDWNGTLLGKNDVHPSALVGKVSAASAPTAENLRTNGYLLRGWLSVQKIAEVKTRLLDRVPKEAKTPAPVGPPPKGKPVKVPITRDLWVSNVGPEGDGNNGGSPRLKVKSHQEMSIFDVDLSPYKGHIIHGATLHLHLAGEHPLHRATISSIGSEWVEGRGTNYTVEKGSSTFNHRQHPNVPWAHHGSDLCSVILGQGGSVWRMADATPPDQDKWQTVVIDPLVLKARLSGISHGFLLFDDTGSEWKRDGEKFTSIHFPNRFFHSRESGPKTAPYLTLYVGEKDEQAPGMVKVAIPKDDTERLPAGEFRIACITPEDAGSGTVGFLVSVNDKPVPRYLIPAAGKAGELVSMHLRDLNLKSDEVAKVSIKAVDGAGNIGEATTVNVTPSKHSAKELPKTTTKPFTEVGALPKLGKMEVAIIDELDKLYLVKGELIPQQPNGYFAANHLWSAKEKRIRLHAAKNEFVAFQILLEGTLADVVPSLKFANFAVTPEFSEYRMVATTKGPLPDPLVPLKGAFPTQKLEGRTAGSIHGELYIPHTAKAGTHEGTLTLTQGDTKLDIAVTLTVWDFTLTDHLSFIPEMNGYSLPAEERGYYRMANRHRTVVNIVPYSQSGRVDAGWGPSWNGKEFNWKAFDQRFGAYFSGAAFADLPRGAIPLECFYLPIHENWPAPVEGNYNGDYWADRAFPETYRKSLMDASRQFADHMGGNSWHQTLFQFYLNNKVDYKRNGWSRGSAPWILDEPANFQDFWALRYYASAFHEGIKQSQSKAKVVFRADISRPMWQRDSLDGLMDYLVVSGAMRPYHRMVMDRRRADSQIVLEYGGANAIEDSNMQAVGWCIDAWSIGANGVVPWQTIGTKNAWEKAETTCLFYPPATRDQEPTPSVRLKAFRRGQQDVEYLVTYAHQHQEPVWALGSRVREALKLVPLREGTGFTGGEDAGILTYRQLRPQDVWALRVRIGESLSHSAPKPMRKMVEFATPVRDPGKLEPRYATVK